MLHRPRSLPPALSPIPLQLKLNLNFHSSAKSNVLGYQRVISADTTRLYREHPDGYHGDHSFVQASVHLCRLTLFLRQLPTRLSRIKQAKEPITPRSVITEV